MVLRDTPTNSSRILLTYEQENSQQDHEDCCANCGDHIALLFKGDAFYPQSGGDQGAVDDPAGVTDDIGMEDQTV